MTPRWQGALVVASLIAAVLGTVALVASPAGSPAGAASTTAAPGVAAGLRVEVRGGEPFVAYRLADRLTGVGASMAGVSPAPSLDEVAAETTIVYYDREAREAAGEIRAMLGKGTLRRQQAFEPPVDVTIVLGRDLPRL
jgi:hypothetical protein